MNIRKKIKETVAKIATEKKARKLAESNVTRDQISRKYNEMYGKNPNTTAADVAKALGITEQEVMMVILTPTTYGSDKLFEDNLNEDHEVSMAQSSLDTIIRSATELKTKIGNNEIDIPAWIQDHITNSETYIDQASQGYHEYSNGGESTEMNIPQQELEEGLGDAQYYKAISAADSKTSPMDSISSVKRFLKTKFKNLDDNNIDYLAKEWAKKTGLNESQQELEEAMIRRWQHYAGIK
jgi:hypothetical protein